MLESLVASLLNRFLGAYVKNFDPKQLDIGIWSGDVKLKKLKLKQEALDELRLPIDVIEGYLGQLTLQIPWSNLRSKPVKVLIEDVYILASPRADSVYNEKEDTERSQKFKMEKLANTELFMEQLQNKSSDLNSSSSEDEETLKSESFTESLVTKIIDNLQVSITNIHIRYEDSISTPGHPFSLGFTLSELSAVSVNEKWEESFIENSKIITHKLAKLSHLSIYWNTDSSNIKRSSPDDFINSFKSLITATQNQPLNIQYVLKPVSGIGKLTLQKERDFSKPKIRAQLIFDEIGFILDEDQYRDALSMADLFHISVRTQRFKKYRPNSSIKENPKAWLLYAFKVVYNEIHERNYRHSWAYLRERRDDRNAYIKIFKKRELSDPLTLDEESTINKLESKLSFDDLKLYRTLARNQIKVEKPRKLQLAKQKQQSAKQQESSSWLSWVWGEKKKPSNFSADSDSSSTLTNPDGDDDSNKPVMTDEQRKELYDAIEWDERTVIAQVEDVPREAINLQLDMSLKKGSFTLKRDPHKSKREIAAINFNTFKSSVFTRTDSFLAGISLMEFSIFDGTTDNTCYPQIVQVSKRHNVEYSKGDNSAIDLFSFEMNVDQDSQPSSSTAEPFFQFTIEKNPLDGKADSNVMARMKSLEIYYNKRFLEEISKFFKPPRQHMESIGALLHAAGATVQGITNQTRAGLEYALQEHKTLNAKLDIQAPLIIIPQDITDKYSECLLLDAGHVSVVSDLVDHKTIQEIQSKQKSVYNKDDWIKLESAMYDKFHLYLKSTQVLVGPSFDELAKELHDSDSTKKYHIIDRISVDLLIEISILSSASNLTKFKVSGHLPDLTLSVSDWKYKTLMRFLSEVIPDFSVSNDVNDENIDSSNNSIHKTIKENKDETDSTNGENSNKQNRDKHTNSMSNKLDEIFGLPDDLNSVLQWDIDDGTENPTSNLSESVTSSSTMYDSTQQKMFEFKFIVDKLRCQLLRSGANPHIKETPLVTLFLTGLELEYSKRQFDMSANVRLHSLIVEDHIEEFPNPEFKNLIYSEIPDEKRMNAKDLFTVDYQKVDSNSPEFLSVYHGIEQNIKVNMSTLNFVITRASVLTLLNFILDTFTSPNEQNSNSLDSDSNNLTEYTGDHTESESPSFIKVSVNLNSIVIIFNDDGIQLANFELNEAQVDLMLKGSTMKVATKLGNFNLVDDINAGASPDSSIRHLVSIEGNELIDLVYETFNPLDPEYPGYNSSIYLRSASVRVNFIPEPFRKIIGFLSKFAKMKAIYDSARNAAVNQAAQVQDANKIHLDIIFAAPILVFPRSGLMNDEFSKDVLISNFGELYMHNEFIPLDNNSAHIVNKVTAGIRSVHMFSSFNINENEMQNLDIIKNADISVLTTYIEHFKELDRPDLVVQGSISNLDAKLTDEQYCCLMALFKILPTVFSKENDEDEGEKNDKSIDLNINKSAAQKVNNSVSKATNNNDKVRNEVNKKLVINDNTSNNSKTSDSIWTTVDVSFNISEVGLELFTGTAKIKETKINDHTLSKFALQGISIKLKMLNNSAVESEFEIQSFLAKDSRTYIVNKFREILPSTNNGSQLMASISVSPGEKKFMSAILSIDNPRVIFALDYLFDLRDFFILPQKELFKRPIEELPELSETESVKSTESDEIQHETINSSANSMEIFYNVTISDASLILIQDPTDSTSLAIVLRTKQMKVVQQQALTFAIDDIGMFLCKMGHGLNDHIRIIDDFNFTSSISTQAESAAHEFTSICAAVDELVLRLSFRDILLALSIINKVIAYKSNISSSDSEDDSKCSIKYPGYHSDTELGANTLGLSKSKPKTKSTYFTENTHNKNASGIAAATDIILTVLKREDLTARFAGLRLVIIGYPHEIPFLDLHVEPFTISAKNWSTDMEANTIINMFANVYNFAQSAWEPLVEKWSVGFYIYKTVSPENLVVDISSRRNFEVNITSQTIALFLYASSLLSSPFSSYSVTDRDSDTPYRICNQTGYSIKVQSYSENDSAENTAIIKDNEEIPWRFEDWRKVRENLEIERQYGNLNVELIDSDYKPVNDIFATREGENMFNLKNSQNEEFHRMICEVHLEANFGVKHIIFRSALLFENNNLIPIDMQVSSKVSGTKIFTIEPNKCRAIPLQHIYDGEIRIRPAKGFGYGWSENKLFWKDLIQENKLMLRCIPEDEDLDTSFYFVANAIFDKDEPLTKIYPHMKIKISPPIQVQNLLPYDFSFKIYNRSSKKEWNNYLRKGGISPVHVVSLEDLLLLNVHVTSGEYAQSDFAVINSPKRSDFRLENTLNMKHEDGQHLRLKLHYHSIPDSGGAFIVVVYTKYLILNKTGLNLQIKTRINSAHSICSEEGSIGSDKKYAKIAKPKMFSFSSDEANNRVVLQAGESGWSKPQSFDALGSKHDVVIPSNSKQSEIHLGMSIAEGEGKYKLTKVITLSPRFIITNRLSEEISIKEKGGVFTKTVLVSQSIPLESLMQGAEKQISLKFSGSGAIWSAPFNIDEIGHVHVKVMRSNHKHELLRIDIYLEDATIFLSVQQEKNAWPFSVRNYSDMEFYFYQSNPFIYPDMDESDILKADKQKFRPIRYRLPPKSVMPYAWDFPSAKVKELIVSSHGVERYIQVAEIGTLLPFVLPAYDGFDGSIIEINVVADGPGQSIVLTNYDPLTSIYKLKYNPSKQSVVDSDSDSSDSGRKSTIDNNLAAITTQESHDKLDFQLDNDRKNRKAAFEVQERDSNVQFKVLVRFEGIGISLVNSSMKELAYLTFKGLEFRYNDSDLYQTFSLKVKWIQIDNELFGGIYPIVLFPTVIPKNGKEMEAHPTLSASISRVKDNNHGVVFIKYATILLQEITVEVDEDFLFSVLEFIKVSTTRKEDENDGILCDESLSIPEPIRDNAGQDVYFEILHLQPMQMNLSFVRTDRINIEDRVTSQNALMLFLNILTMAIGNINDAPVKLNALLMQNVRVSFVSLEQSITTHYGQEFLFQVHKILGSADFIGNPVGLFNNISSGVMDIFYEPYNGFIMTDRPEELGIGLAKGGVSFMKKSVFGVSDSISKFTDSVAKGLAVATLDQNYQDTRRALKIRNKPKDPFGGFSTGTSSLIRNISSGVLGLATSPMDGAAKEGASGFFKGIGKGLIGLPTKTAIGILDFAGNVSEGVRNCTTIFDEKPIERVRLPRFIDRDGILTTYSEREALGQTWLKTADDGRFFEENYLAHLNLDQPGLVIMVTYKLIFLLNTLNHHSEWVVCIENLESVVLEDTGIDIVLKDDVPGPFIPISDPSSRSFLYEKISYSVKKHNTLSHSMLK